jgi:hypothetical protein
MHANHMHAQRISRRMIMSIMPELSTLIAIWPTLLLAGLLLVEFLRMQKTVRSSDRRPVLIALEEVR